MEIIRFLPSNSYVLIDSVWVLGIIGHIHDLSVLDMRCGSGLGAEYDREVREMIDTYLLRT